MAILFNSSKNSHYLGSLLLFAFAIVVGMSLITISDLYATSNKELTLSPLRNEYDIAPGTSKGGSLTVTNSTNSNIMINLSAEEFNVANQQYDYVFSSDSGLVKWVTFDRGEVYLGAEKSAIINYQINVPLSEEPGGRYISLFASTDTGVNENTINLRQRVASLLYVNVTGNVTRKGKLLSLDYPWLSFGQNQWGMSIQNKGTTHFRSRYNVSLKNIISDTVIIERSGDALVLPGSIRSISDQILVPRLPGVYKLLITVGLGDTPSKTESRLVIYFPPYSIMLLVIIIIMAIIIIRRKRKH